MRTYHAFLVRCWHDTSATDAQAAAWRFLVTEIGAASPAPHGFGDWEQLVKYLAAQLAIGPPRIEDQAESSKTDSIQTGFQAEGGISK